MWLVYTLITLTLWTIADLFYKIGAKPKEKYSHLKIFILVGFVFGVHAIFTLLTSKNLNYNFINIIKYFPVSLCYALSMGLSYYGQRFVANSISSPIEESGGALTALFCFIFLGQRMEPISFVGVSLVLFGVFYLVYSQAKNENNETIKKYGKKIATIAILMALSYAIIDSIGSSLDAYFLDIVKTPLVGVTEATIENVANTSYELMFFISGIIAYIYMRIKGERLGTIKDNKPKLLAAITEMGGQFFYVFAMSGNAIVAAPILSSVCLFSVVLSMIFLKEKLAKREKIAIFFALIGILILGIAEVL